jgi:lactaldehyde dehydrogenase/glycolaldehyde dehydrogenase
MVIDTELDSRRKLLIGGHWRASSDRATRPVINPATGEPFTEVPEASGADVEAAVTAAVAAQPAWEAQPAVERGAYLRRVAALMEANRETLARIVTLEMGKPIAEARGEIGFAASFFTFFAEFDRRIEGEVLPSENVDEQLLIERVPYGVVAAVVPWNGPCAACARKIAPALIAGNTIVLKAHEDTPLSALALAEILVQAGLPDGVVNVLTGAGETVGEALITDPRVNLITMTGSVPVGKRIMAVASRRLTPVSLELGGKAPFIVLADADIDAAVRAAVKSRHMNGGQVCIANERTLVQRPIYDQFVERYIAQTQRLRMGDPQLDSTELGPRVNKAELDKLEAMVQRAREQGARVEIGGKRPEGGLFERGYWYTPTVLTDIQPEMEIMQREIFGPVTPIMPFDEFDQAFALANDSLYGLSAYLFTTDLRSAMRGIRGLNFGELYINRMGGESIHGFHSGYRQSGLGGEDGKHGLERYLRKRTVYLNYAVN